MDTPNALQKILNNLEDSLLVIEETLTDAGKSITKNTLRTLKKSGLQQTIGKTVKSFAAAVKNTATDEKFEAALLAASLLLL